MTLVTNIRVNVEPGATPADDGVSVSYLVDGRAPSVTKQNVQLGTGAAALVTATEAGELNAFGVSPNTVFQGDGATAGGIPRTHLQLGTSPAAAGRIRLSTGDLVNWADGTSAIHAFLVESYGAVGDAQQVTDGTTTATDATLTSASNPFVAADVGKVIRVRGAGAAGADHYTTIASFTSAGSIEMTDVAVTSVAGTAVVDWGTDNATAIQAALTACKNAGGGVVQLSTGTYGVTENMGLTSATGVTVRGMGMQASQIVDLRAEEVGAGSGALTGAYAGLLSFVNSSRCSVQQLTLVGTWRVAADNTAIGGRKATFAADSNYVSQWMVEATGFIDEAIYCHGDCEGWSAIECYVHDSFSNAININSGPTVSRNSLVAHNRIHNVQHCAVLVTAASVLVHGNLCSHLNVPPFGSDIIAIDACSVAIVTHNEVRDYSCSAGVSLFHAAGIANPDALILMENNLVTNCTIQAQVGQLTTGAAYMVSGKVAPPTGTFVVRNNAVTNVDTADHGVVHAAIRCIQLGAGCMVVFDGNVIQGNVAANLITGFENLASDPTARILAGTNTFSAITTQYDLGTEGEGADHVRLGTDPAVDGLVRGTRGQVLVAIKNSIATTERVLFTDPSGNIFVGARDAGDNIPGIYMSARLTASIGTAVYSARLDDTGFEVNSMARFGSEQAATPLVGQISATAGRFAADGDAQRSSVNPFRESIDNAAVELTLTGAAPSAATRFVVPAGRTYTFTADGVTRCTAGTDAGKSASWHIVGTIENVGGATALVGSVMNLDSTGAWNPAAFNPRAAAAALATCTLVPSADDANDSLVFTFTGVVGASANTFHTNVDVRFAEVG